MACIITIQLLTLNVSVICFFTSRLVIVRVNLKVWIWPFDASFCLTFPFGIAEEYSFIIITVILVDRCLEIAAFLIFCLGKTIDSANGSNGLLRFFPVLDDGKNVANALASACVGFLILETMSIAHLCNVSYKMIYIIIVNTLLDSYNI